MSNEYMHNFPVWRTLSDVNRCIYCLLSVSISLCTYQYFPPKVGGGGVGVKK